MAAPHGIPQRYETLSPVEFCVFWHTVLTHQRNNVTSAAPVSFAELSTKAPMAAPAAPQPPPALVVPAFQETPKTAAAPAPAPDEPSSESAEAERTTGIQWRSVLSYRELFEAVDPEELMRRRAEGFGNAKQLNNTLKSMRLAGIKKGYNSSVTKTHKAPNTKVATLMRRQLRMKGYRVSQVNMEKPLEVEFAVDQ